MDYQEGLEPIRSRHLIDGLYVDEMKPGYLPDAAPPILFLHGAFQGAWSYERWMTFFARSGWRALAMSLRNHPGSAAVEESAFIGLSADDYVSDVLRIARWIDGPFVLVAHSMGSQIALLTAERCPEIGAVVLLGPGGLTGMKPSRPKDLPSDQPVMPDFDQFRRHMFGDVAPADYADFHSRLVPESPGVMNVAGRGRVEIDPVKVKVPMLVVDGEYDRNRNAEAYSERFGADFVVIPGGHHGLMLGPWGDAVAMVINHWLMRRCENLEKAYRPAWSVPASVAESASS